MWFECLHLIALLSFLTIENLYNFLVSKFAQYIAACPCLIVLVFILNAGKQQERT